jgi:hypothetical protein
MLRQNIFCTKAPIPFFRNWIKTQRFLCLHFHSERHCTSPSPCSSFQIRLPGTFTVCNGREIEWRAKMRDVCSSELNADKNKSARKEINSLILESWRALCSFNVCYHRQILDVSCFGYVSLCYVRLLRSSKMTVRMKREQLQLEWRYALCLV